MAVANSGRIKVALVGCGALAELYYAKCLAELEARGDVRVVAVADPNTIRTAALKALLPSASETRTPAGALGHAPDLAIIASPPRFHSEQSVLFLENNVAVLCEKPMAGTLADAEKMLAAAERTGVPLAIGLFRRFYPSSEVIRSMVRDQTFGKVTRIDVTEGGPFNWPAASASFFRKAESDGGVLADVGVHVLDLLIWWFGYPVEISYEDDAMGGLEANCAVTLRFPHGVEGRVRLSRDTKLQNSYVMRAERGTVVWQGTATNEVSLRLPGAPWELKSQLTSPRELWASPNYQESFARQLWSVLQSLREKRPVEIPASEGIQSLRLIHKCYAKRRLMEMPWLSPSEQLRAKELAA